MSAFATEVQMQPRAIAVLILAGSFVAACGGTAAPARSAAPAASTAAGATSPAAASSGPGSAWAVTSASKATASVREQLVGLNAPSDAVLVATGATGAFAIDADGTFTPGSKIAFDLTTLTSDQRGRDNFIKQSTLQVAQYPTATFVPKRTSGPALPPSGGDLKFTVTGAMTIHGVTKDVTFDVVARRSGSQLAATATAVPSWRFGDFGMTAPSVPLRVVSVADEIRLVVELVATAAG